MFKGCMSLEVLFTIAVIFTIYELPIDLYQHLSVRCTRTHNTTSYMTGNKETIMTNVIQFPVPKPKEAASVIVNITDFLTFEIDLDKKVLKTHTNNHVSNERVASSEEVAMALAMFKLQVENRTLASSQAPWTVWDNFFFTPTREGFPDDPNKEIKQEIDKQYPPSQWFIFARTVQSLVLEMRSKLPDNLKLWALEREDDDYIEYQLRGDSASAERAVIKFTPVEPNEDIVVEFNIFLKGEQLNTVPWFISTKQDYAQVASRITALLW